MTTLIENSIEIARTPEDVFDYLSDMGNEVRWNPDCVSMEQLTGRARRHRYQVSGEVEAGSSRSSPN